MNETQLRVALLWVCGNYDNRLFPPVLPSGVVDRLEEDEETLLANVSSICTEKALFGKFCDWVLDPNVDNLMELSCLPSDRCPYPKVTWGVALPGATSEEGKVLFR